MTKYVLLVTALGAAALWAQTERWVHRYSGPGDSSDFAFDALLAPDGNVYVEGGSCGGGTLGDFVVLSLTNTGARRWVYRRDGAAHGVDRATCLDVCSSDTIVAAGWVTDGQSGCDAYVVCLDSCGDVHWSHRYQGADSMGDAATALTRTRNGGVLVAVESEAPRTGSDIVVVCLDSAGQLKWQYRYRGPGDSTDVTWGIAEGLGGSIYLAGRSYGATSGSDFVVIGLTEGGGERWVRRYNGPANGRDYAKSITLDTDENVYVAGWSDGIGTGYDFTVLALSSAGDSLWTYRYDGSSHVGDCAYEVIYGDDGHLYAVGLTTDSVAGQDLLVVKLTASGEKLWEARYDGPRHLRDEGCSITLGDDGYLYVAGWSQSDNGFDFLLLSFTTGGAPRWEYRYDGPYHGDDFAGSVSYGWDGSLYVAGSGAGANGLDDILVVSLDPAPGIQTDGNPVTRPTPQAPSVSRALTLQVRGAASLLNTAGRAIMDLVPGPNDLRGLASGVYFICEKSQASTVTPQVVRKVVIQQ